MVVSVVSKVVSVVEDEDDDSDVWEDEDSEVWDEEDEEEEDDDEELVSVRVDDDDEEDETEVEEPRFLRPLLWPGALQELPGQFFFPLLLPPLPLPFFLPLLLPPLFFPSLFLSSLSLALFFPPFLQTVLHKQTQASPSSFSPDSVLLLLFLSEEVLFLLRSSVVLFWLVLLLEVLDELVVLEELDELVLLELCFFSYSERSSLRFFSHSEFSFWPLFLNLHTLSVSLFPSIPRPTANSGAHPLAFVGGFRAWLGLSDLNVTSTSWHSDCLVRPAFLPHLQAALKSSPSAFPSIPVMKLSPWQLVAASSALQPFLNEISCLFSLCDEEEEDEEEDELAFCDPDCSLDVQNRRTVILEYWNELELEALDELPLDDEPDGPLLD
jgi:hypothetical protein